MCLQASSGVNGLRIDNSGRSMICAFDHMSETVPVTITCHTSNKREYFILSFRVNVMNA